MEQKTWRSEREAGASAAAESGGGSVQMCGNVLCVLDVSAIARDDSVAMVKDASGVMEGGA